MLQVDCILHSHTYNRVHVLESGLKINEKSSLNFATGNENLVAISQNLLAKSSRCVVLSAV